MERRWRESHSPHRQGSPAETETQQASPETADLLPPLHSRKCSKRRGSQSCRTSSRTLHTLETAPSPGSPQVDTNPIRTHEHCGQAAKSTTPPRPGSPPVHTSTHRHTTHNITITSVFTVLLPPIYIFLFSYLSLYLSNIFS